jgi:hypothetical protein
MRFTDVFIKRPVLAVSISFLNTAWFASSVQNAGS